MSRILNTVYVGIYDGINVRSTKVTCYFRGDLPVNTGKGKVRQSLSRYFFGVAGTHNSKVIVDVKIKFRFKVVVQKHIMLWQHSLYSRYDFFFGK